MLYRLSLLGLCWCWMIGALQAQGDGEIPSGNLSTPQEVAHQHIYYINQYYATQSAEALTKAAAALVGGEANVTDKTREQAIKLKQIFDGRGLMVREDLIPDHPDYIDSVSGNAVYVLFPDKLPEVYMTRPLRNTNKRARQYGDVWRYDASSLERIPELHRAVYPLGSHLLLEILPQGGGTILGLRSWQYLAVAVLLLLGFILHLVVSFVFNQVFKLIANTQLGRNHFDESLIQNIARLLSYVVVAYVLFIFLPVLMLPVWLSFYLLGGLRIFNTVFAVLIVLNGVELARSYFEMVVSQTENTSDDQLLPIFIRIIKVVVISVGAMYVLDVFDVDLTAVIAGLSIGGLALALAAQDTVKHLIGSVMIYMDRPFQLGDFITSGEITGTVEDIGFRSTRIRTPDSSLISVPNGALADMVVNNVGSLKFRRFNTTIGVTYDTPPALLEAFIEGLREINQVHPMTDSERSFIHLNKMSGSSIDILFIVFFQTTEFALDLKLKEELIFAILKLAEAMGVSIAFPSTSVYIETMPGQNSSPAGDAEAALEAARAARQAYLDTFKAQHPSPPNGEDEEWVPPT